MVDMERPVSPEREGPQILSGIYEHFKSTPEERRYYFISGIVKNTETGELYAIYKPMYETTDTDHKFEVRPIDMFTGTVEHNGKVVPRFTYIGPEL
jgi:hypothetical protein